MSAELIDLGVKHGNRLTSDRLARALEVLVFLFLIVPSLVISLFILQQSSLDFGIEAIATIFKDLSLVGLVADTRLSNTYLTLMAHPHLRVAKTNRLDWGLQMGISPLAGRPAPTDLLINVSQLERDYYEKKPDAGNPTQVVAFGTSGHRGTPFDGTFTEAHVLAITQAICDYRNSKGIDGPIYMGKDTHAASGPAQRTALEVLAANEMSTIIQEMDGVTPTPVISHAILVYNRGRTNHLADGIIITPSHNPPGDGGFKYNPPNGGPAETDITSAIQDRANQYLRGGNSGVKRISFETAIKAGTTKQMDFAPGYVADLRNVVDMEVIRASGLKLGVDPLGGASVHYWDPIRSEYGLDLTVVNKTVDPTFSFMTVDHDGKIRMDCSSPYAMERLVGLKDQFRVAFANDPDADRHGIVTPSAGLMNPNHYLAVAIGYLLSNRPRWPRNAVVRQDTRQQQHDRPCGPAEWPHALRSSGRFQVVCPGALRWFLLLWG